MAEYATGDGYIAALIAAQHRSRDREDSTRIGCPLPPNPTVGKHEDIQDADPQPPSYETLYIQPRVLSRDNWSGVKSGPPGPIFACEIWTALAKSGPGIQKPAAVGE